MRRRSSADELDNAWLVGFHRSMRLITHAACKHLVVLAVIASLMVLVAWWTMMRMPAKSGCSGITWGFFIGSFEGIGKKTKALLAWNIWWTGLGPNVAS